VEIAPMMIDLFLLNHICAICEICGFNLSA